MENTLAQIEANPILNRDAIKAAFIAAKNCNKDKFTHSEVRKIRRGFLALLGELLK
jgi:hypothetical protein